MPDRNINKLAIKILENSGNIVMDPRKHLKKSIIVIVNDG